MPAMFLRRLYFCKENKSIDGGGGGYFGAMEVCSIKTGLDYKRAKNEILMGYSNSDHIINGAQYPQSIPNRAKVRPCSRVRARSIM